MIGSGLAHVQSFFDDVMDLTFSALKKAGEKNEKLEKTDTAGGIFKSVLKGAAGFLGEAGHAFYEKYEKIKADKVSDKSNKKG